MGDLDEWPMADQRVRHRICPIRSRQTTVGQHLTIQLAFLPFLHPLLSPLPAEARPKEVKEALPPPELFPPFCPLPAEGKLKEVEQAPPTPNERNDSFLFDDMYLNRNNLQAKHPFEGVESD